MYKCVGQPTLIVVPTGEACNFDYDILLVEGNIPWMFENEVKSKVCRYVVNLVNKQLKNKEIKYKMLKSQLQIGIDIWLDVKKEDLKIDIEQVENVNIKRQKWLGGRLL